MSRARAQRRRTGRLAFGTVDSFLLWRLTGGKVHATDATNAARTLLLDIHSATWDGELADLFRVPLALLPEVRDCAGDFGTTDLFGGPIRILGVAGDQQAATVGQGCFAPGMMKSTYGTGCFALLNTGPQMVTSRNRLLTTIAYQLGGKRTYALEGAIFIAGAAVQWLRDGLKLIASAPESGALAARGRSGRAGLSGAGLRRARRAVVGRAGARRDLRAHPQIRRRPSSRAPRSKSVGYQTRDLIDAMRADWPDADGTVLRVDGGMTASDAAMQFLADILDAPVDRPVVMETTALGAAYLAGLAAGVCPEPDDFAHSWQRERRFEPHDGRGAARPEMGGLAGRGAAHAERRVRAPAVRPPGRHAAGRAACCAGSRSRSW